MTCDEFCNLIGLQKSCSVVQTVEKHDTRPSRSLRSWVWLRQTRHGCATTVHDCQLRSFRTDYSGYLSKDWLTDDQASAIRAFMSGRDVFVMLPTATHGQWEEPMLCSTPYAV